MNALLTFSKVSPADVVLNATVGIISMLGNLRSVTNNGRLKLGNL